MVLQQYFGDLKEVRPGRTLFIRKVAAGPSNTPSVLTIVALHGTCASESQYAPLLQSLDDALTEMDRSVVVWLYDNVGCGSSPVLEEWDGYSNENFALDLQAILTNLVLPDHDSTTPCVLLGHSYSPTIILEMMNRYPVQDLSIQGFIFASSAIRSRKDRRDLLMKDGGHPIMRLPVFILNCLQKSMSESFLQLGLYKDCDPALREKCRSENNGNNMAMAKATHRHHKWATSDELGVMKDTPTLILHGTEDGIISPANSEVLGKEIPNSKVVLIPKASHLLMLEKPGEMAKAIVDFLNDEKLLQ
jgi:pimeloyl-ACP methyl ester carboxylesterase